MSYFLITRGVSLKNTEKNKTVKVPINKNVYTRASIEFSEVNNLN
jgi:hypothetical protein